MIAVDLKGSFLGTKFLVEPLSASEGAIVLTSSVNAKVGRPEGPPTPRRRPASLAWRGN